MPDSSNDQLNQMDSGSSDYKTPRVLLCEDSLEGILSAIHMAYISRYGHRYITIELIDACQASLFSEYINVAADLDKAISVSDAIKTKISMEAWHMISMAAYSRDCRKAQAIYRFVILGFYMGGGVCQHYSDEYVHQVFGMNRQVSREAEKLKGFVRFRELKSGILFSKIAPKNHQLYLLGEHFADRFPMENWVIYDETRKRACLHKAGGEWLLTDDVHMDMKVFEDITEAEAGFLNLWKAFFAHIEIKERKNPRCQMNLMPKRYWSNMPEMNP